MSCNEEDCPGCVSAEYVQKMRDLGADDPDLIMTLFFEALRESFNEEVDLVVHSGAVH